MTKEPRCVFTRRLKRIRFPVRDLVVLAAGVATVLGWFLLSVRIQREAVEAIVRAGGTVRYSGQAPNGGLTWSRTGWWPPWLVGYLGPDYFYTVVYVYISPHGSEADMVHIGRLHGLQELWAGSSPGVTDRSLANIKGLTKLRVLSIQNCVVTDDGLVYLKDLKNLQTLYLANTSVTDAGLVHLRGLSSLMRLDLRNTLQVRDAGLVYLRDMTNLSELFLNGSSVTDAGLSHLKCLRGLTYVRLDDMGVSRSAVQELRRALPNAAVSWRYSR